MRRAAVLPLLLLPCLAGCTSLPPITAVITGGAAGAASGNPAVGFAVGVATDAAANYGVRWYGRSRQNATQDAIAGVAGPLPVGTTADWRIDHFIPLGNEHGTLQVVRLIANPLADCKEVVFSVDSGHAPKLHQDWYDASVCRQAERWKWASAEPAVPRWGYLQ
jgi:hypothetical protein